LTVDVFGNESNGFSGGRIIFGSNTYPFGNYNPYAPPRSGEKGEEPSPGSGVPIYAADEISTIPSRTAAVQRIRLSRPRRPLRQHH